MADTDLSPLVTVADFARVAGAALSERARAYIDSGAADEVTLADNVAAWNRIALAPRVLTGAGEPDPAVTLLGRRHAHPLVVAPTAFAALAHPDAEPGIARAATATATTLTLSTLASVTPAQLAAAAPDCDRWFQLYVFSDRGITRELVASAEAHGFEALVLTVDRPVLGTRDRERRQGVRGVSPDDGTVGRYAPGDTPLLIEDALTWSDVEAIARDTDLPIVIKGILTADDARAAVAHGAAALVVSNHGGRQLDTVLSGADALPEVADAVGDEIDVIVDGGVRRGTDVVKALALGARAVMIGRPLLWGLAAGGEAGARRVLELLLAELRTALALTGVDAEQLTAAHVRPAPWART